MSGSVRAEENYLGRLHRDNKLSVLLGPIKLLVPALSYIFIYPLMLSRSSIEVLGLWSLLATTVSFLSITDVGFSQLLVREAGVDKAHQIDQTYRDYISAQIFYGALFVAFLVTFYSISDLVLRLTEDIYSTRTLKVFIPIMVVGTFLQLASKLDAAVLRARHDNYFVHFVGSLIPIITYIPMITGALVSKPIEGLALGTLFSGFINLLIYRYRVVNTLRIFETATAGIESSFTNISSLCRRGWVLFSTSLGLMLRAPIYRFLIAATAGLPAVAAFDIAMRITQTARDAIAAGFGVLYPSFAILVRKNKTDLIIELIQVSLIILISVGSLSLGLVVAMANPVLTVWLNTYPADTESSVTILALWQMLTLFNLPFWFLLMASENEKIAAYSIWVHTMSLLLIIPISSIFDVGIVELLIYWVLTSLFTQVLIFYFVESRLQLFWAPLKNVRLGLILILAVMFMVVCYSTSNLYVDTQGLVSLVVPVALLYSVLVGYIGWQPIKVYLNRKHL